MTERINHAEAAVEMLKDAQAAPDLETINAISQGAQVHATLALVEQQRIANLIAMFQLNDKDAVDAASTGFSYLHALTEIRDGLGLS